MKVSLPTDQKLVVLQQERGRASIAQGRYDASCLKTFQECPFKFYCTYILGLQEPTSPVELNFGSLVHQALFTWYETRSLPDALKVLAPLPSSVHGDFYHSLENAERLIELYTETFGTDSWDVLYREVEFELLMPNGTTFTGRMDQIIKWSSHIYIHDFKTKARITSTWSEPYFSDIQMEGYVYAARQLLGECSGAMITAINKSKDPKEQFSRDIIQVPGQRINDFPREYAQLVSEIHYAELLGWPRHRNSCYNFFRRCPFWRICVDKLPRRLWSSYYLTPEGAQPNG